MRRSEGAPGPGRPGASAPPRLLVGGATGRLGSAVCRVAEASGMPVAGGICRNPPRSSGGADGRGLRLAAPTEAEALLRVADVYVGASLPEVERTLVPLAARWKRPVVLATTGFAEARPTWLRAAARSVPIVWAPNFSLGVHLVRRAARGLGPLPEGFDAGIVEAHRRDKRDRPSATALALARDLEVEAARSEPSPPIGALASLRLGDTPGLHSIVIGGRYEVIRLEHIAYGREAFAEGIVRSARWVHRGGRGRRPGLYTLDDVVGHAR